jgi:predicted P-loop ATPase
MANPFELVVNDDDEERLDEAEELDATAQRFRAAPGAPGSKPATPDFDDMDEGELLDVIQSGAHYWRPAKRLLAMWARQGISQADAESNLTAAFDAVLPANRTKKWAPGRKAIPKWVKTAYAKAAKRLGKYFSALVDYIENTAHWRGAVRFNRFTQQIEVSDPFPPQMAQVIDRWRALRDPDDTLEAMICVQADGFPTAGKGTVFDALTLVSSRHKYHPVQDWLDRCRGGDEIPVSRLFLDYFPGEVPEPADKQEEQDWAALRADNKLTPADKVIAYYEHVGECFMVGLVARAYEPGCKLDTLPVPVSPQGFDKSQGLQALVPDPAWFTDDLATAVSDRDAKESLTGKWLVELSEFPHIRKDIDRVKAFFSRQTDRYRRAYGRLNTDNPRQCGFCATANELEFLDVTGNRRCWPIPLGERVKVADIVRDRDKLWANAVRLYFEEYKWWLSPSLEAIAGEMQDAFIEGDEWDAMILGVLDTSHPANQDGNRSPFTVREVLRGIGFSFVPGDANFASKADEMRVARRLRRLGFRRDPHRNRSNGRAPVWISVRKLTP